MRLAPKKALLFIVAAVILVGLKLWLVGAQDLCALGGTVHDDERFIRLAKHLVDGQWLGPFNEMTLIKGSGYPVWIALIHKLHFPLLLAQHLLYVAMCAALSLALVRRASPLPLLLCFTALLFNPSTFAPDSLRVLRCGIYPALVLGVMAGVVGLYESSGRQLWKSIAWGLFLGGVWTMFWLTREEGVWLMPLLVCGLTAFVCRGGGPLWRIAVRAGVASIPVAVWWVGVVGVGSANHRTYGVAAPSEMHGSAFCDAYGAVTSVKHEVWRRYVPVPKEARQRIYRVSPAFTELEPYLEGDVGEAWSSYGRRLIGDDSEIAGAFFLWAMRDAVLRAGYYRNGHDTMAYYRRVADEIRQAAKTGELECHRISRSLAPRWNHAYLAPLTRRFVGLSWDTLCFRLWHPYTYAFSIGTPESLAHFEEITGESMAPVARGDGVVKWIRVFEAATTGDDDNVPWDQVELPAAASGRVRVLGWITRVYRWFGVGLMVAAVVVLYRLLLARSAQRPALAWWLLPVGTVGAVGARILLLAYIDVASFSGVEHQYVSPCYVLMLAFCCLVLLVRLTKELKNAAGCEIVGDS